MRTQIVGLPARAFLAAAPAHKTCGIDPKHARLQRTMPLGDQGSVGPSGGWIQGARFVCNFVFIQGRPRDGVLESYTGPRIEVSALIVMFQSSDRAGPAGTNKVG